MQFTCWSLAHFPNELSCETGSFSRRSIHHSPQSALSVSFTFRKPGPCGLHPRWGFSQPALPVQSTAGSYRSGCSGWFFNPLVVGVPCSLIFWLLWLFIDFRSVAILLSVVWWSEGFLPTPPSWLQLWSIILYRCQQEEPDLSLKWQNPGRWHGSHHLSPVIWDAVSRVPPARLSCLSHLWDKGDAALWVWGVKHARPTFGGRNKEIWNECSGSAQALKNIEARPFSSPCSWASLGEGSLAEMSGVNT